MIHKHTLPNGLRVVTVPLVDHKTVTVLVLVGIGARDESKKQNGISHFLEHMCFKGTKKRPTAFDISRELDGLGAQSNAFTSYEYTGYYAKSHYKHLPFLLDVVSDIYQNSTLPDEEIQKEKGVVIEEINMYNDRPEYIAGKVMSELLYGDTPFGRTVGGDKETVSAITQKSLAQYKKEHYNSSNTVVVISGKVDESETLALVKDAFSAIEQGLPEDRTLAKMAKRESRIEITFKESDQAHMVMGLPGYDVFHKDKTILSVLSALLGGGMSSRLFQKIREEMGVAYYVYCHATSATDCGDFQIAAGVDKNRVLEVCEAIQSELQKLINNEVDEDELAKVKEYLIGNMYLDLESSDAYAYYYGIKEVMRRPLEAPSETERRIRAVTKEDIHRVAQDLFKGAELKMSIVGPFKSLPGIEKTLLL